MKLTGGKSSVHKVKSAGHEACRIGSEKIYQFRHLVGFSHPSQGIKRRFGTPVGSDIAFMRDIRETLKQFFCQGRVYGPRADGVHTNALWPQINRHAFGDLPQSPLGETIGEAVRLSHIALVGSISVPAFTVFGLSGVSEDEQLAGLLKKLPFHMN